MPYPHFMLLALSCRSRTGSCPKERAEQPGPEDINFSQWVSVLRLAHIFLRPKQKLEQEYGQKTGATKSSECLQLVTLARIALH